MWSGISISAFIPLFASLPVFTLATSLFAPLFTSLPLVANAVIAAVVAAAVATMVIIVAIETVILGRQVLFKVR